VDFANLGSESETFVGSYVRLVGVSISFEKNFYQLPFPPPSLVRRIGPSLPCATCIVMLPNGLCNSQWVQRQIKSTVYCWLSSTGTPSIALDSSGPSVQAPGATSMQAPGATSVEAQLLFRAEGLMTGSRGTSGSAPVWAI
jgi:hypothetical protein